MQGCLRKRKPEDKIEAGYNSIGHCQKRQCPQLFLFQPSRNWKTEAESCADRENRQKLQEWKKRMNIIIVGCGKVGSALAEQLSKEDNDVTIVDLNYELVQDLSSDLDIMGVVGSGSNHQILEEAGIEKADLLIAVTGSDELNLLSCLIAKKAGNCQTIARVRNPEYSRESSYIKEELGLAMVINPELAAANEIARLLRFPSAIKIETFAKGRVELLKFRIQKDSVLHEMEVKDIITKLHSDVLVCAVERGDQVVIPTGNFELREKRYHFHCSHAKSSCPVF